MNGTMSAIDLSGLTEDGDTLALADGRVLRLRIASDDIDPFEDFEMYGRIASAQYSERNANGFARRPDGFDGAAEKLSYGGGDSVWWQPPTDLKRTDSGFAGLRKLVIQLLECGMMYVSLEILDGVDAYRRPIVTHVASLSGIDSLADGYIHEVVSDLYQELGIGTDTAS